MTCEVKQLSTDALININDFGITDKETTIIVNTFLSLRQNVGSINTTDDFSPSLSNLARNNMATK